MARFLITGAKGQVGSCLVPQLQGKAEVLALARDELDITNQSAVKNAIISFHPDIIINAAAYTAVDRAETDIKLAEAINISGAQFLAGAANEIDAAILHISTDYVFDGTDTHPYKEDEQTRPQSVYGRTKLAGEIAVQHANPKHIILRTAWVFGEYGNNFVKTMLRLGKEREVLGVVGDQLGGPTYAGDIACALIQIANQIIAGIENVFGVYHFSGQPYVSWYEFAEHIFTEALAQKLLEKRPHLNCITTSDYPTPAKRPANSCLNLDKIKNVFGIAPSDWQKALKNLKAYR